MQTEGRYPEGGKPYSVAVGAVVHSESLEMARAALAKIEAASIPPTKAQAEDWLVMLQAACAGGRKSEISQAVALELYAGALCRFPADVARQACMNLALVKREGGNWFPMLAELNAECEALASPRQAMLTGLRNWRPPTLAEVRQEESRDWLYAAALADDELKGFPKPDPEHQSELVEFIAAARSKAKALRIGQ